MLTRKIICDEFVLVLTFTNVGSCVDALQRHFNVKQSVNGRYFPTNPRNFVNLSIVSSRHGNAGLVLLFVSCHLVLAFSY